MIAIVRVEGTPFDRLCLYELRINKELICTFEHQYSQGLGQCLMRAFEAYERKKWTDASRTLEGIQLNDKF